MNYFLSIINKVFRVRNITTETTNKKVISFSEQYDYKDKEVNCTPQCKERYEEFIKREPESVTITYLHDKDCPNSLGDYKLILKEDK